MTLDKKMEKSVETKGKICSSEAKAEAVRLLELMEAEMVKVDPSMAAKIQIVPKDLRLKLLLLAALEASSQNQPVSDWGDVA